MNTSEFPKCCSAFVIHGFGGGHEGQVEDYTKQSVILYIKNALKRKHWAVAFATVTSTQPNAIAALEEMGFYTAPNVNACSITKRNKHKIYPFFLPKGEWNEKAFDARYNPNEDKYVNKLNYEIDPFPPHERYW